MYNTSNLINLEKKLNNKLIIVNLKGVKLYFSYSTIVAFSTMEKGLVISSNIWSRTTGKHLNYIDPDKNKRIKHAKFKKELSKLLKEKNLI